MDSGEAFSIICPETLAPQVILGTIDVAAVGARVLLSLQPPPGWTVRDTAVEIRGLGLEGGCGRGANSLRPVLTVDAATGDNVGAAGPNKTDAASSAAGSEGALPPLLVRNMYAPAIIGETGDVAQGTRPQVSLVILNTAVPEDEQAAVAAALLDLVTRGEGTEGQAAEGAADVREQRQQQRAQANSSSNSQEAEGTEQQAPGQGQEGANRVYLAAAVLLQHVTQPAVLYQHLMNGAEPPASPSPLPHLSTATGTAAATRVRDGQLAALLHVLEVSGTSTCCLLAPGHKPPATTPLDLPASLPACDALGAALASALGLQYDAAKCRTVRATRKWFVPEKAAGSDVMYL